jgi:hypothetical protein
MKFRVTMKDPDTLHDAVIEAVNASLAVEIADQEERDALADIRIKKIQDLAGKWFEYDEYLTVEIDTEAGTCTVCQVSH